MALTTIDDKLAVMNWDNVWEPGIIIAETAGFDQGDKQQLIWGMPTVDWAAVSAPVADERGLIIWFATVVSC